MGVEYVTEDGILLGYFLRNGWSSGSSYRNWEWQLILVLFVLIFRNVAQGMFCLGLLCLV